VIRCRRSKRTASVSRTSRARQGPSYSQVRGVALDCRRVSNGLVCNNRWRRRGDANGDRENGETYAVAWETSDRHDYIAACGSRRNGHSDRSHVPGSRSCLSTAKGNRARTLRETKARTAYRHRSQKAPGGRSYKTDDWRTKGEVRAVARHAGNCNDHVAASRTVGNHRSDARIAPACRPGIDPIKRDRAGALCRAEVGSCDRDRSS